MGNCAWGASRTGRMTLQPKPSSITDIQASSVSVDCSSLPMHEVDGKQLMSFYWIDAYEEPSNPGTVFLFGKVGVANDAFVSCCVTVRNIQRCLYLLPRKKVSSVVCLHKVYLYHC